MIIPVRCFSCGKVHYLTSQPHVPISDCPSLQVIGDLWEPFVKLLAEGSKDGYVRHLYILKAIH